MADFEDFFGDVSPEEMREQAVLPDIAITEPLGNVLPNTILYPPTVKFAGVYAVDAATNLIYLNTKAEVGNTERNPTGISGSVLPLVRVLTVIEDEMIDGFIVDGRNSSVLSTIQKTNIAQENERAELFPDYFSGSSDKPFYVPALAVMFETADKRLGINGDQRLKNYGFGLVLEVNEFMRKKAKSYDSKPEGTYRIMAKSQADDIQDQVASDADTEQDSNPAQGLRRFFKK